MGSPIVKYLCGIAGIRISVMVGSYPLPKSVERSVGLCLSSGVTDFTKIYPSDISMSLIMLAQMISYCFFSNVVAHIPSQAVSLSFVLFNLAGITNC